MTAIRRGVPGTGHCQPRHFNWGGKANLIEALTLFFEIASPAEVSRRFENYVVVTQVEVPIG